MTIRLSSLGYNMLRIFATEGKEYRMSIEVAGKFDQRPFGSMLANEYILWDRKGNKGGERGFAISLVDETETRHAARRCDHDRLAERRIMEAVSQRQIVAPVVARGQSLVGDEQVMQPARA